MSRRDKLMVGPGLALAVLLLAGDLALGAAAKVRVLGEGSAYATMGELAVMHAGRIKPLDTVAREEVKHVFGRETIKLHDGTDTVVETWGPVAAFLDWTIRPEYWDDQPFILVDYLPLRQLVLADSIRSSLKDIAARNTTTEADRAGLVKLAGEKALSTAAVRAFLDGSELSGSDRQALAELAAKLSEEHKWLTPHELDDAKINHKGQTLTFTDWVAELDEQSQKFKANPASVEQLTETERRAIDAGRRLMTYKSYSSGEVRSAGIIRVMPRPSSYKALGYLAKVMKKARETANPRGLSPLEFDTLKAIDTYWNDLPREQRHDPLEDPKFDEQFSAWLRESSVWVPLKVLLKSKVEDLVQAGYPEPEVKAFVAAYHDFERAEDRSPGEVSEAIASAVLGGSRKLGEGLSSASYPSVASIERETHFNAMNPFWQAPIAYGAALALFAISLGFASGRGLLSGTAGRGIYLLAMTALGTGILLEVYGFYLRIRISGWAPVTNMYETVIWVALVAAVLSFVFELVYRRIFPALAGSGVALLGTITAVNVPLLDPSIHGLQPVLRSNLWLTIHVLTEVSSYAAFGLAWALGLIAICYYLTAVYHRSPRYIELAVPLLPGLLLGLLAAAGWNVSSWGVIGSQSVSGDVLYFVSAILASVAGIAVLGSLLAMGGEFVNRLVFRETLGRAEADAPEVGRRGDHLAGALGSPPSDGNERGNLAVHSRPRVEDIRLTEKTAWSKLDVRQRAMQETAQTIKPLANFIYRAMQVGVLLIAAGTILGGVWADYSWGRFWGWDPKEVWALITLLVYLVPLHGRFAGWVNTFGLVVASIVCFNSVVMAWYGVNFVLGVGLHSYGFTEGGSQGLMSTIITAVLAIPAAGWWRRFLGYRELVSPSPGGLHSES